MLRIFQSIYTLFKPINNHISTQNKGSKPQTSLISNDQNHKFETEVETGKWPILDKHVVYRYR